MTDKPESYVSVTQASIERSRIEEQDSVIQSQLRNLTRLYDEGIKDKQTIRSLEGLLNTIADALDRGETIPPLVPRLRASPITKDDIEWAQGVLASIDQGKE